MWFCYFSLKFDIFYFLFVSIVVSWVHCGIYKSSYTISNISYFNSSPPSFPFNFHSPHSWNSFNRSHFSIYIHVYTVFFVLYSPSYILFPHAPPPTGSNLPPPQTCSALLFSKFIKKKRHFYLFTVATQEFPCEIFMYKCVITLIRPSLLFFFFLS
jgi:hypothetical protein